MFPLLSVDANSDDGADDNNTVRKASIIGPFLRARYSTLIMLLHTPGTLHPHCPLPPPSQYHLPLERQWELLGQFPCLALPHLKSVLTVASGDGPPLPTTSPCPELPREYNPDSSLWLARPCTLWALPSCQPHLVAPLSRTGHPAMPAAFLCSNKLCPFLLGDKHFLLPVPSPFILCIWPLGLSSSFFSSEALP